jgi:hypothetical protein
MNSISSDRYDRNILFFGKEGQAKLSASHVAVVGIGGLGTHVVQQLALLGVGHLRLIDKEELDETNLNRYVGARHDDPIPGTLKVAIGERIVREINPSIRVETYPISFVSADGFNAITKADYVFGCLDREGARLILTELCAAYARPYIDLASGIEPGNPLNYGGHICIAWDGDGCLFCYGLINVAEAQEDLASPEIQRNREEIYGIKREALGRIGPSVVSINGVIASLGVTEFMLAITGIRPPKRVWTYRGHMGRLTAPDGNPAPDCYYCKGIHGSGDSADVQRYIRAGLSI